MSKTMAPIERAARKIAKECGGSWERNAAIISAELEAAQKEVVVCNCKSHTNGYSMWRCPVHGCVVND